MKKTGGMTDLDTTLSLRKPEVQVVVDREAASDLGIPVGTIADTLRILVGGLPVSKFRDGDEQYDVWLRAAGRRPLERTGPVPTCRSLRPRSGRSRCRAWPSSTKSAARARSSARTASESSRSRQSRRHRAGRVRQRDRGDPRRDEDCRPAYSYTFGGQAKTLGETGYYFLIAFGLSITFMYLILAAQFESWTQPIAILMALPVTIPFGLLSLVLFQHADGHLRDVRPVHAGGHRQEKRHLAGRRHQPAAPARHAAARGDHRGQPHPAAADPDDHRDARRRHGADRPGQRPRPAHGPAWPR